VAKRAKPHRGPSRSKEKRRRDIDGSRRRNLSKTYATIITPNPEQVRSRKGWRETGKKRVFSATSSSEYLTRRTMGRKNDEKGNAIARELARGSETPAADLSLGVGAEGLQRER